MTQSSEVVREFASFGSFQATVTDKDQDLSMLKTTNRLELP
jgi:hypothetical protein